MAALTPRLYFADPTSGTPSDPSTWTLSLDLNTDDGFTMLAGFDDGDRDLAVVTLSNETEDDEEVISTRRPRPVMTIPLAITQQDSWAALLALVQDLDDELDRDTNGLVFSPDGESFMGYTTYRAAIPSVFGGQRFLVSCLLHDSAPRVLSLTRDSEILYGEAAS